MDHRHGWPGDSLAQPHAVSFSSNLPSRASWQASSSKASLSAASPRMAELLRKIELEISSVSECGEQGLGCLPSDLSNLRGGAGGGSGAAPAPPPRHRQGGSLQWPERNAAQEDGYRCHRWMAACQGLSERLAVHEERASAKAALNAWAVQSMRSARVRMQRSHNGAGSESRGGEVLPGVWGDKGVGSSGMSTSMAGSLGRSLEDECEDEMEEIEAEFERLEERARAADAAKGAIEAITKCIRSDAQPEIHALIHLWPSRAVHQASHREFIRV